MDAGFHAKDLKAAGFTLLELIKVNSFDVHDLKTIGVQLGELKAAGFRARDLEVAGFTDDEINSLGFCSPPLSYSPEFPKSLPIPTLGGKEIITILGGYDGSILEFYTDNYEIHLIIKLFKAAGCTPRALIDAGFSIRALLGKVEVRRPSRSMHFSHEDDAQLNKIVAEEVFFTVNDILNSGVTATAFRDADYLFDGCTAFTGCTASS